MQLSWFPQSVCNSIERKKGDFVWKGNSNKGLHLVGWKKKIAKPKKDGGLVIREARLVNISLLGKLVWDLMDTPHKLWVQIINKNISPVAEF